MKPHQGDVMVEAHGSFAASHCIDCKQVADDAFVKGLNTNGQLLFLPQSVYLQAKSHDAICAKG
jgi:NAD-dependent SIR2 family protein deacetylase